ncbi:MAG: hypothetical protein JEY94_01495 [Melioribacteraceae bacterium]|nr:hypothetical protein [Melioribacteraceae bacterium]
MAVRVLTIIILLVMCFSSSDAKNMEDEKKLSLENAPKVFIDGDRIDLNHVRREVNYVNYVRDRQLADIYVLVTTRRNASRGEEFTLTFIGMNGFSEHVDTLLFNSNGLNTDDEIRNKFVSNLKLGLMPYILKTPIARRLTITYNGKKQPAMKMKDSWDFWVFRTRISGSVRGEQLRDRYFLSGDLNADRITEDWKIRFDGDIDYDEEKYKYDNDSTWTTNSKSWSGAAHVVKSISNHWSVGVYSIVNSSTYSNIKTAYRITPAIEYNVFPYDESTYREIRISYFVGPSYNRYHEETIYKETSEILVKQGVSADIEFKQPWGEIDIRGEYTNYLHDISKKRFGLWGWLSFNVFKGFSVDFGGSYSKIHDQMTLPKRDLDLEEILLRRSELATQYSYRLNFGVGYTFGAIYNNIVNSRFGD